MTMRDLIRDEYFEWMLDIVQADKYSNDISFRMLLEYLHATPFRYSIDMDDNRADDGVKLRRRFALESAKFDVREYLTGPCSVLELMIALAIRCEETITYDTTKGDRTGQWFWNMVTNLGLGSMTDARFDLGYVEEVVERFLDREYEPDGRGGLFRIRNCPYDLRDVHIWRQMCWYIGGIV